MLARVRAVAAPLAPGADLARVIVEPPKDPTHGDMATNAAMVLAKDAGKKPRELADAIAAALRADDMVAKVDVAGPGFINLTLKPHVWGEELRTVSPPAPSTAAAAWARGEKVNVEYVSANPTGPMHVGHGRGAVFGDALANLLAFRRLRRDARILHQRRRRAGRRARALGLSALPRGARRGHRRHPRRPLSGRLSQAGRARGSPPITAPKLTTMAEAEWLPLVRAAAIAMMMEMIRDDLAALNIRFDVYFSERSLIEGNDQVGATIESLRAGGEVYEGRLPPPKGGNLEDWEDREQTLFRSTAFGDDVDRPLKKSDGSYTYFASDIAYHKSKVERGFLNLIDVWGADHGGYIKRMQAAVKAVSGGKATLDVKLVQLVRLLRAGEPVKMSKRAGEFVTLREVVDEVGRDAVRFDMLYRKNDAVLDFDLAKVIEASRDNPVFYVQYGHARGAIGLPQCAGGDAGSAGRRAEARRQWLAAAPVDRLERRGRTVNSAPDRALSAPDRGGRGGARAAPGRLLSL